MLNVFGISNIIELKCNIAVKNYLKYKIVCPSKPLTKFYFMSCIFMFNLIIFLFLFYLEQINIFESLNLYQRTILFSL